ncbi:sensor histidine kinase [Chloroflexus sp.]|uniref:sensor histidine kinase n=1 Tax=Chloroflexus sp. TaxID=1904827 RepID=UPI0026235777|nr:sensor histidine kinase [uncultured Chloroflexus sp.]
MNALAQWKRFWQRLTYSVDTGQRTLMLAAYAIISVALVEFILFHRHFPPAQFYLVVLSLSLLLALNAVWDSLQNRWGKPVAGFIYFGLGAALFLSANYFGLDEGWTFLPFLLFVLASQAVIELGVWRGLGISLCLTLAWSGVLWLRGAALAQVAAQTTSIALGLIFTLVFSIALVRMAEQKARAEQLAAELRDANAALAAARERELALAAIEERMRLAREIHDGLGHHLTALNVQLQAAARLLDRDRDRAAQALALCREEAQAALAEVRQSVAVMRANPLANQPLADVIASLVRDFGRVSSLHVSFELEGKIGAVAPAVAMTLFRAAQEGLTNAQKHAQATTVTVRLKGDIDWVQIEVINNGPPALPPADTGFGLAGLRERATQLGGTIQAEPRAEGGFRLVVRLPQTGTEGKNRDPHFAGG